MLDKQRGHYNSVPIEVALEIIEELNGIMFEDSKLYEDGEISGIDIMSNGSCYLVEIMGIPIWDTENDSRNWIHNDHSSPEEWGPDEDEMLEPLETFLIREVKRIFSELSAIHFRIVHRESQLNLKGLGEL